MGNGTRRNRFEIDQVVPALIYWKRRDRNEHIFTVLCAYLKRLFGLFSHLGRECSNYEICQYSKIIHQKIRHFIRIIFVKIYFLKARR